MVLKLIFVNQFPNPFPPPPLRTQQIDINLVNTVERTGRKREIEREIREIDREKRRKKEKIRERNREFVFIIYLYIFNRVFVTQSFFWIKKDLNRAYKTCIVRK